jgi:hypothetical protein
MLAFRVAMVTRRERTRTLFEFKQEYKEMARNLRPLALVSHAPNQEEASKAPLADGLYS